MRFNRLLAIVLVALSPLTANAAAVLTVEQPVIAGLGTQIRIDGMAPSQEMDLSIRGQGAGEILIPVHIDAAGSARVEVRGEEIRIAGAYQASLEHAGQVIVGPQAFTVLPDSIDVRTSTVRALQTTIAPDARDTAEVVVTLMDRYGNPLAGRPVTLVSSRATDDIAPLAPQTDARGELHFLVSTATPGSISLRAIDLLSGNTLAATAEISAGTPMGGTTQNGYSPYAASAVQAPAARPAAATHRPQMYYAQTTASFDVIDHFEIVAPETMPAGQEAARLIVRAVDRAGRLVEDYVGTIIFSTSDPSATLPNFGQYTFRDRDLGQKEFPLELKFERSGEQTLRAEDTNDPSIFGETTILVEGGGAGGEITVTSPQKGASVNTLNITVNGQGPRFSNLIVMGGQTDVAGATDRDGNFSIAVALNPNKKEFTLRVRDEVGRADSGPIDIVLDRDPPQIGEITFSPEKPKPGENTLIVVRSEPGLRSMVMRPSGTSAQNEIQLLVNPSASGAYQAFFAAPETGSYQPTLVATDGAGNETQVRAALNIGQVGLPTVQNVRGETRLNSALLEWDALEDVEGYRIYVGESPEDFGHTLDTGRVTTRATVAGLTPGKTYYFAVTALAGERESTEKSKVLELMIPGLVLKVMPGNGKLQLEWTPPNTPLLSYKLEYGVVEGTYTEARTIVAAKDAIQPQAYTMGDLLNGVTYHLRLTPVSVTGETLSEMAATTSGTPTGDGFDLKPGDPLPFIPGPVPPTNTGVGVPLMAWLAAALLALAAGAFQWHRRRSARQNAAFLAAVQSRYHR